MPNFPPAIQPGRLKNTLSPSASLVNKYAKVNTDRKGRQDARERRRYGDWDILEIPTALLWLDAACAATAMDPEQAIECEASAVIDLWP